MTDTGEPPLCQSTTVYFAQEHAVRMTVLHDYEALIDLAEETALLGRVLGKRYYSAFNGMCQCNMTHTVEITGLCPSIQ